MRKMFWQITTTLDGFMEGPNRELNSTAQVTDRDFDRYTRNMLRSIDTIILGRKTYEFFAAYWPNASGPDADKMNELPKVVFSKTLKTVTWNNSRLAGEDVIKEISHLKNQPGKDIAIFGSAGLASTFMRLGLIDEYRVLVTPFVLGVGKQAFKGITNRLDLRFVKAAPWSTGIVAVYYNPA